MGEKPTAGKLLPIFEDSSAAQIFFDHNIELDDPKLVDCCDQKGIAIPASRSLSRFCFKVNLVEAVLDDEYFIRKVLRAENAEFYDRTGSSSNPCCCCTRGE